MLKVRFNPANVYINRPGTIMWMEPVEDNFHAFQCISMHEMHFMHFVHTYKHACICLLWSLFNGLPFPLLVSPTRGPAAQSRGKTSSARAAKGSARPVCKSEPGTETLAGKTVARPPTSDPSN